LFLLNNLIWVLLLGLYCGFGMFHHSLLTLDGFSFIVYSSVPIGFIVLAEAIALLSGNFDVSVGEITGFAAMASAYLITRYFYTAPIFLIIFLPLLIGLCWGAFNGFFIGKLKLNPFLVTLGTFFLCYGGTLEISSCTIYNLPKNYLFLGNNLQTSIITFFIFVAIFAYVIFKTTIGTRFMSVGSNPTSSRMVGINIGNYYLFTFMIIGLLCGMAAIMYTGYLNSVPSTIADNTVFMAFAGAILGGISLRGGRGSITNVVGGVLMISVLNAGLTMFNISPFIRQILFGLLIIVAIILNRSIESSRDRILMKHPS